MSAPPWMLVRLALETRQHHADADADRLAIMEVAGETEYRDVLARIYGFEAAVENEVEHLPAMDRMFFTARGKQDRLHADLLALGMSDVEVLRLPRSPVKIRTAAQAHGWMFVLERQRLLSGLLRRHLACTLPDCFERAGSYLASHVETAGASVRAFGEACGEQAMRGGPHEPRAIVAAAGDAFRHQRQWYAASKLHARLRAQLDEPPQRGSRAAQPPPAPEPAVAEPENTDAVS